MPQSYFHSPRDLFPNRINTIEFLFQPHGSTGIKALKTTFTQSLIGVGNERVGLDLQQLLQNAIRQFQYNKGSYKQK